jgi:GcrA cell cycle regulator
MADDSRGKRWSEEGKQRIKTLWDDGKTAGEIAAIFGVERNAILGVIHRNKWQRGGTKQGAAALTKMQHRRAKAEGKPPPPSPKVFKIKRAPEDIQPPTFIPEPPAPAKALNVAFMDLRRNQCRWPLGESPFLFCGLPQHGGRPYCPAHSRIAYQPVTAREKRNTERLASVP